MTEQEVRKRDMVYNSMTFNAECAKAIEDILNRKAPQVIGRRWEMADLECMTKFLVDISLHLQKANFAAREIRNLIRDRLQYDND